jgi:hypothetical protein
VSDPFQELRAATLQLEGSAALLRAQIVKRLKSHRPALEPVALHVPPPSLSPRHVLSWVETGFRKALFVLARTWRGPRPE